MEDKVKYWIELSDYDLETAEAMLRSKRFLYVGFMCHQTIEKAFKAYFTFLKSDVAPYSHSLSYLPKKETFTIRFLKIKKILLTKLNL
jgi:HEPN domain-containing protein